VGFKTAGADLALKGGVLAGNRWLAAMSSATVELSGSSYARNPVALSDWVRSAVLNETHRYITRATEDFPLPTGAWANWTHWGLHGAVSGTAALYYVGALTSGGGAAQIGAAVGWNAGDLGLGFTGAVTPAGSIKALVEGLLSGTRRLSIHSDDPANPQDHLIDDAIPVVAADWTLDDFSTTRRRARNNKILSFGAAATDPARPVWVAISDGTASSDDVLWKDMFDSQAQDPALGDTISFGENVLDIRVVKDAA